MEIHANLPSQGQHSHISGTGDSRVLAQKTGLTLALCNSELPFRSKLSQLRKGCLLACRGRVGGVKEGTQMFKVRPQPSVLGF